jgi:hypothetical protein
VKTSRLLKLVSGGIEALLAIPVLGGLIIVSLAWTPLLVMLVLHIVTLVYCNQERESKAGSIVGIVTSALGWIPFLGWMMHVATAILLLLSAAKSKSSNSYYQA